MSKKYKIMVWKRVITCVVTMMMLLGMVVSAAPAMAASSDLAITVGDVSGQPGDTVTVPVTVTSNPGIANLGLVINYDPSVLTVQMPPIIDHDIDGNPIYGYDNTFTGMTPIYNLGTTPGEISLAWASGTAAPYTGVVTHLTFTIASDATAADYPITVVTSGSDAPAAFSAGGTQVNVAPTNGTVTVESVPPVVVVEPPTGVAQATSVQLDITSGYEYRMNADDSTINNTGTFIGLTPDTSYSFEQRVAATANTDASAWSAATDITTSSVPAVVKVDQTTPVTVALSNDGTISIGLSGATATATGGDGTGAYTYTSSNTSVATVDANGNITAIAPGTTEITAIRTGDSAYNDSAASTPVTLTVTPTPASVSYALTLLAGTGGTVTGTTYGNYGPGSTITITAKPNVYYTFNGWTSSNGGSFGNSKTASTTFTMPANNTQVTASFVYAGGGGSSGSSGGTPFIPTNASTIVSTTTPSTTSTTPSASTPTPVPSTGGGWQNPFSDVKQSDWFYGDVANVVSSGLFTGTSATVFSPQSPMTRGMFVTALWRLANSPASNGSSFTDVTQSAYYAQAVSWAASNGVVKGISSTLFAPNAKVTREQMASILYRYEQFSSKTPSNTTAAKKFADGSKISSYAQSAVNALVQQGMLGGKPGNLFDPQGTATRAEVASMLHRFTTAS